MFTVLSNTRNANLYMITALAILTVVLLTFAFIPSISVNEPAAISENPARLSEAFAAYHLGEKAVYTDAVDASSAFSAYVAGEKVIYANPVALSEALSVQHLGEKAGYTSAVDVSSALSAYIAGEKAIYTNSVDLDTALSAWRAGEKTIVQTGDVEAALWTHRMGEKGLR